MLERHRVHGRPSRGCEGISGYHMVWGLVILGFHVEGLESGYECYTWSPQDSGFTGLRMLELV